MCGGGEEEEGRRRRGGGGGEEEEGRRRRRKRIMSSQELQIQPEFVLVRFVLVRDHGTPNFCTEVDWTFIVAERRLALILAVGSRR